MSYDDNPSSHPYYHPPAQEQTSHQDPYRYEVSSQSEEGVKAAKASTILGCVGIVAGFLMSAFLVGAPAAVVLGILGVKKAKIAESHGVLATSGKVASWLSIGVGGLLLVLMGLLAIFAFAIAEGY